MEKEIVKGTALAAYASYLINDDDSGISAEDKEHADRFRDWLGGDIVGCSEDSHFYWQHDASNFGALAGECVEYTALVDIE